MPIPGNGLSSDFIIMASKIAYNIRLVSRLSGAFLTLISDPVDGEALWWIEVSKNWVIIGSGNGLVPNGHQAITQTNGDLIELE